MLFFRESKLLLYSIAASSVLAGVLHIFPSAIGHITPPPPLESIFFVSIGIVQVVWAYTFFQKQTEKRYIFGMLLNGGAIVLWLLTRLYVAPFQEGSEHIGLLDVSVMLLEFIAVIGLITWHHAIKQSIAQVLIGGLIAALLSGFLMYGSARSLELIFPERESAHGHSEDDGHVDEEPHDDGDGHVDEEPHDDGDGHVDEEPHDDGDGHVDEEPHDDGDGHVD